MTTLDSGIDDIRSTPCLRKFVCEPLTLPVLATGSYATDAFDRSPLSVTYRPFVGPIFKARFGSRAVGRRAKSDRLMGG